MTSEYRTARAALRLFIHTLRESEKIHPESAGNALELVDVLYRPIEEAESRIMGATRDMPTPKSWPIEHARPAGLPRNVQEVQLPPPPPTTPGPPEPLDPPGAAASWFDPSWRPVIHKYGAQACQQPAYFLANKIHPRKKADINNMRMIPTGKPPVIGVDPQICGSCHLEINPFGVEDLDFRPHIMTPQEIHEETYGKIPVDPALEQQNRESRRWETIPDSQMADMIGIAQTMISLDDQLLPPDADAGLPPDSTLPKIEDLELPAIYEEDILEPDIPAPTL